MGDGRLSVAAVNSPAATVISGDPVALAEFEAELSARRVLRWPVPASDFVAHSPRIDELAETLTQDLAGDPARRRRHPPVLHGDLRLGRWLELGAGYWSTRPPAGAVRACVRVLLAGGYRTFVEVSPHAVLTTAVTQTAEDAGADPGLLVTGTLDREDAGAWRALSALARVHVRGLPVDWAAVLAGGRRVDLPTYPFQHQRFWPQAAPAVAPSGGDGAGSAAEAQFWAAVEGGDLRTLACTLAVEDRERLAAVLPALASWRRRERDRSATQGWRYRITWAPVTEPDQAALSGTWLVLTPAGKTSWPGPAAGPWRPTARPCSWPPSIRAERAGLSALLRTLVTPAGVAGVISLLATDEVPLPAHPAVPRGLAATLTLVQALGDAGVYAPLWLLTRGAVAAEPGEVLASPVQGQAWGLGGSRARSTGTAGAA